MPLTEVQKQLVTGSFARVIPISEKFAQSFYNHLWEIAPETKVLFANTDMPRQRMKLIATIATVINSINTIQVLAPTLRELGNRHIGYGVTKTHYNYVGQALLSALEQELGNEFTAETKEAWAVIYNALVSIATEAYTTEETTEVSV